VFDRLRQDMNRSPAHVCFWKARLDASCAKILSERRLLDTFCALKSTSKIKIRFVALMSAIITLTAFDRNDSSILAVILSLRIQSTLLTRIFSLKQLDSASFAASFGSGFKILILEFGRYRQNNME